MINEALKKNIVEDKAQERLSFFNVAESEVLDTVDFLFNDQKFELKLICATDERKTAHSFKIYYIFGIPGKNKFIILVLAVDEQKPEFPSIVSKIHFATWFEREILTFFGLIPIGHPDPQTINLHENWPKEIYPLRKDFKWNDRPETANNPFVFQKVKGEGIYEIPVGPVHAGIIEPGHFRFSVSGEDIVQLEPRLGYKHKGIEKLFETLPIEDKLKLSERVSGDSSFNHSLAFAQAVEGLAGIAVPKRAQYLRVIFAELERLANHFNDVGFMMLDTGFSFGGAQGARLRELVMQLNEKLGKSRFLRGVNQFGGVSVNVDKKLQEELLGTLNNIKKDFQEVVVVIEETSSLLYRLKDTGLLDRETAENHGVLGVPARGMGIAKDSRVDYPYEAYGELDVKICTQEESDVYARFLVKIDEIFESISLITRALGKMPEGSILEKKKLELVKNSFAIGVTEGFRGDIVYFVATDEQGEISRVYVRDTSFINWALFRHAVAGNVVPEFPLINKSFNLSYSGSDK